MVELKASDDSAGTTISDDSRVSVVMYMEPYTESKKEASKDPRPPRGRL